MLPFLGISCFPCFIFYLEEIVQPFNSYEGTGLDELLDYIQWEGRELFGNSMSHGTQQLAFFAQCRTMHSTENVVKFFDDVYKLSRWGCQPTSGKSINPRTIHFLKNWCFTCFFAKVWILVFKFICKEANHVLKTFILTVEVFGRFR